MKKICALLLAFILIIALAGCKNQKNKEEKTIKEEKTEIVKDYNIVIKIKDYGTIEATLDGKAAPITVKNFVSLINEKFYDGLTFHRIIKDLIIILKENLKLTDTIILSLIKEVFFQWHVHKIITVLHHNSLLCKKIIQA